ncbi:L-threonylcarbamoyladenylate synthase [Botrimarina hoheduenensis]|uniref:L-threonylcarbamoyladenylate synthase n=1 Tax=Botrimarina hoheduenensis TaxID=2528000 RepID=UPI0018D444CF|nr:L-threonylcarbamoyladenylate synthase [Botrimarina hoheduenensis]
MPTTQRITSPQAAAEILRSGGLVAFPTETVFGLGADATNPAAVERLFEAKGRPGDNPLIVHVPTVQHWSLAASELTPSAKALLAAFAPGPLTVVLPKRPEVSPRVTAGLTTVGVRVPHHPVAAEILRLAGAPIAAPSANRSGRPSGTTWRAVLEDLDGLVDAVYCEDGVPIGIESTVVDCCGPVPIVLRLGAITIEQIRTIEPEAHVQATFAARGDVPVASPGLRHPHYQPRASVRLFTTAAELALPTDERLAYCGLEPLPGRIDAALEKVFPSLEAYAAGFYEFLREADRQAATLILVQRAPSEGIGAALQDRQRRAAGK